MQKIFTIQKVVICVFIINSQLFGEHNEDEDVSPDTEDPEAAASAGDAALQKDANKDVIFTVQIYI